MNVHEVISKVDECIIAVCDKVQNDNCALGEYADTIKALAELVSARALIFKTL